MKAYFPEFLTLFADPDRPVALALLQTFPTRDHLQAVSRADLEAFLRRHHCPHSRKRATAIHERMQAPGFHIAPPIVRAKARLAGTLASQLQALVDHIDAYEFLSLRDSTLPAVTRRLATLVPCALRGQPRCPEVQAQAPA